ncbi:MAG: hypothetical protein ACO1TE_13370 [Prosthecobacter sp.]
MKSSLVFLLALAATHAPSFSQQPQQQQIQFSCKVVSIPFNAPEFKDAGLSFDAAAGLANLGVVPFERAAAMLGKLEKASGVSLLAAPTVITKAGQRCNMESIREFIYPTEYEMPKLDGGDAAKPVPLSTGQIVSVLPATPKAFETRPVGLRIEIDASISPDQVIQVNMAPELVSFDGFINHGTPIKTAFLDNQGKVQEKVLNENVINQPVFSSVKTVTAAAIPDGQCLILGGLGGPPGPLPSVSQKPDLTQAANPRAMPPNAIFFVFHAKIIKL